MTQSASKSLPALALRRPITVIMIVITMICLGVISQRRIPLEFLPPIDFPFIICQIPYVGATPEQVEKEVAVPAEGEFRTLSKLRRIMTTSDMNGCTIRLVFEMGTDMTTATADVRDRIERLKLILPAEIERVFLRKFSSQSLPIMMFSLYGPGDDEEMAYLVRTLLQPRLMRVDGVADVSIFGKPEREVLIEFNQDALRNRGVGLFQVVSSLRQSSINVSAGEIVDGQTKYFVRTVGEFSSPDEIGRLIIGPNALRLRDVANVGYRSREVESGYAIDGHSGTFLLVRKEAEANAIATCKAVLAELEKALTDPAFADVQHFMFFNQADMITSALNSLLKAGKGGAALAVVVLFFFLLRFRPTFIVAVSIPASIMVSLIYMYFAGMTLNLVTMISLIIALGMLVDNSIVVIENINRHQGLGFSARESALRGASEVGLAITASTLTTVVVFIPLFYLEKGELATYMRQFAVPVTVALFASLVIALTVIPLASAHMKPRHETALVRFIHRRHQGEKPAIGHLAAGTYRFFALADRLVELHPIRKLIGGYMRLLGMTIRWRFVSSMLIVTAVIVTAAWPLQNLERQSMPSVDTRRIEINVDFDQGFDFEKARETIHQIEAAINPQRDELGIKNIFTRYDANGGSVDVYLLTEDDMPPGQQPPFSTDDALDVLWQRLPRRIPGAELRFGIAEATETASRSFSIQLRGDDAQTLMSYAENLKVLMKDRIPEISEINTDSQRARQEVQLDVNETLAEFYGITPLAVAQTVDFALRGIRLSYLKQGGREIPVWAQFSEEDRKSRSNLENVILMSNAGEPVPVNRVVDFSKATSPKAITRVNGKNVVTVTSKIRTEDLGGVVTKLKGVIADFNMPKGYSIEFGDELMNLDQNMSNFSTALLLAVVLIYVVMGALFESYLLPWSILSSLPLAGLGVVWSLYLTGTPVDTVSMIGVILLAGIIVNNGIVLIDYINQLRSGGLTRYDAILNAGRDRFRPVMMTALTTILGCLPLAFGGAFGGEVSFNSLGRALIGGLTVGTLLTLFVVPLSYTIFDDLRVWFSAFFASIGKMVGISAAADTH